MKEQSKVRGEVDGFLPLVMNMEIQLPSDDIITVEFEYIKIEKHCFTYFSLFHEDENCPVKPRHSLPIKERKLGITQRIALQRIEADNRMIVGGTKKRGVARSPVQGVSLRKTYVARTMNPTLDLTILEALPNLIDTTITFKGVTSFVTF
ncbi:hypothetical protein HID58_069419, partial [Brassica napus]